MPSIKNILENHDLILMEAAIVERLRRSRRVSLHDTLVTAPLIYDKNSRKCMEEVYLSYLDIALKAQFPFLMCTPSWRANRERVWESKIQNSINRDLVNFMRSIRDSRINHRDMIKIGGMIGCKNDCYKPEQGLPAQESEKFHSWQISELTDAGVDFLIAETIPNVREGLGIARAMAATRLPYIISFVINRDGKLLDGIHLSAAIHDIDSGTERPPLGFMINCAYPTFLQARNQPERLFERLIGYLANASSLDHYELDGAIELKMESVSEWGKSMLDLNKSFGLKILGGCCGTGVEHLSYIADNAKIE